MDSLLKQLNDTLNDYVDEVDEIANDEMKKATQGAAKDLRSTSPKRTGRYASSWTVKSEKLAGGAMSYTVYNKRGSLTHLLENGHVIRNKKGEYGRAPAHPHIKAAEDRAVQKLIADLESKL